MIRKLDEPVLKIKNSLAFLPIPLLVFCHRESVSSSKLAHPSYRKNTILSTFNPI
jgi:hypothetical protein